MGEVRKPELNPQQAADADALKRLQADAKDPEEGKDGKNGKDGKGGRADSTEARDAKDASDRTLEHLKRLATTDELYRLQEMLTVLGPSLNRKIEDSNKGQAADKQTALIDVEKVRAAFGLINTSAQIDNIRELLKLAATNPQQKAELERKLEDLQKEKEKHEKDLKGDTKFDAIKYAYNKIAEHLEQAFNETLKEMVDKGIAIPDAELSISVPLGKKFRMNDESFRKLVLDKDPSVQLKVERADEKAPFSLPPEEINRCYMAAVFAQLGNKLLEEGKLRTIHTTNRENYEKADRNGVRKDWYERQFEDMNPREREQRESTAIVWLEMSERVRKRAELIDRLHHATSTGYELPGWISWASAMPDKKIFPDDAVKNSDIVKSFVDPATNERVIEVKLPDRLDWNQNNETLMRKYEKFLKDTDYVDSIVKELLEADANKSKCLLWAGVEVEGFIDANGKEITDEKLLAGKPQDDWQRFNYLNCSFSTEEVERNGQKYIKVTSEHKYQWVTAASYQNCGLRYDIKTEKSGFEGDKERLYKPDDWVWVLKNDAGKLTPHLMQAKDLSGFKTKAAITHGVGFTANLAVDALMCFTGLTEARAAYAAARAAGLSVGKALLKTMITRGAFHLALGASGFGKKAIENWGDALGETVCDQFGWSRKYGRWGHWASATRGWLMMADLGWTAFGPAKHPAHLETFLKSSQCGSWTRTAFTILNDTRWQLKLGKVPLTPKFNPINIGMDAYFIGNEVLNHYPHLNDKFTGQGKKKDEEIRGFKRFALEQKAEPDHLRRPNSFDKQLLLKIDGFRQQTEEVMGLPADDQKRSDHIKKLVQVFKDGKAADEDKFAAAVSLVNLYTQPGKDVPDKLGTGGVEVESKDVVKFLDEKRFLAARNIVGGYATNLQQLSEKGVSDAVAQLDERARAAFGAGDGGQESRKALDDLVAAWQDKSRSDAERTFAAAALLNLRPATENGSVSEFLGSAQTGARKVSARDVVDFLKEKANNQSDDGKKNAGHVRLVASDALSRLNSNAWTLFHHASVCLDVLKDKASSPELQMQALHDRNGMRLGELLDVLKRKVEPDVERSADTRERAYFLSATYGRDSAAIQRVLHEMSGDAARDDRVRGLAARYLFVDAATTGGERQALYQQIEKHVAQREKLRAGDRAADGAADGAGEKNQNEKLLAHDKQFALDFIKSLRESCSATDEQLAEQAKKQAPGERIDIEEAKRSRLRAAMTIAELALRAEKNATGGADAVARKDFDKAVRAALPDALKALDASFKVDNPGLAREAFPAIMAHFAKLEPGKQDDMRNRSLMMIEGRNYDPDDAKKVADLRQSLDKAQQELALARKNREEAEKTGKTGKDVPTADTMARLEGKVAETSASLQRVQTDRKELKVAVAGHLKELLKGADELQKEQAVTALTAIAARSKAAPEWYSEYPGLRRAAVEALVSMRQPEAVKLFETIVKTDPAASVRLAALEGLVEMRAPRLRDVVVERLKDEQHPLILKRLREIEFFDRRPDPAAREYRDQFLRAKRDLIYSTNESLSGSLDHIKKNFPLLHGPTLWEKVCEQHSADYYNYSGVRGVIAVNWDGEKGIDDNRRKRMGEWQTKMLGEFDRLGEEAKTDAEAFKALLYIALSNGRPLLEEDREKAVGIAAGKLKAACLAGGPARAKDFAAGMEMCLMHQPMMNQKARLEILQGFLALKPETSPEGRVKGVPATTADHAAIAIATALQRELHRVPSPGDADYADSEKLQKELLAALARPEFRTKKIMPVLEAIVGGTGGAGGADVRPLHPMADVRRQAADLFAELNDSVLVLQKDSRSDAKRTLNQLAFDLNSVLRQPGLDSHTSTVAVFSAFDGRPVQKSEDPRREPAFKLLQDRNDEVRFAAAVGLVTSEIEEDRVNAIKTLADVAKRSPKAVHRKEAQAFLDQLVSRKEKPYPNDDELIKQALASTPAKIRQQPGDVKVAKDLNSNIDIDYQDEFEKTVDNLKRKEPRSLDKFKGHPNWFSESSSYRLLDCRVLFEERPKAVKEAFPGMWEWLFTSREKIDAKVKEAVDQIWTNQDQQFDALAEAAKKEGTTPEEKKASREAREALAYIVLSNGLPFREADRVWATRKASFAIYNICKTPNPGRGDIQWVLRSCLIDEPLVDRVARKNLLYGLTYLVSDGSMDKKTAATIVASALETEYRSMPRADLDKKGYDESVKLQREMIDILFSYRHKMAEPVLQAVSQHHPDASVKTDARATVELLKDVIWTARFDAKPDAGARDVVARNMRVNLFPPNGAKLDEEKAVAAIMSGLPGTYDSPKRLEQTDPYLRVVRGVAARHKSDVVRLASIFALMEASPDASDLRTCIISLSNLAEYSDNPAVKKQAANVIEALRRSRAKDAEQLKILDEFIKQGKVAPEKKAA